MDIQRTRNRHSGRRALVVAACALLAAGGATAAARVKPRAPSVARASVWTGHVERGAFDVRIKGSGTLVPELIRWLTVESSGRVEQIMLKPGARVSSEQPIVQLENLDLRLQALQADRELSSARSELLALDQRLKQEALASAGDFVGVQAELAEARRRAAAYTASPGDVVSLLDTRQASDHAGALEARSELADAKVKLLREATRPQLEALRDQVARRHDLLELRRRQVGNLTVRGGAPGVVQDVLVELGQWVVPGTVIAKLMISDRLKGELHIPEAQAGGLAVGQPATIDTHSGVVRGRVSRIAAVASQGTVKVEVTVDGDMPRGARADQTVDGYVEIEHIEGGLHMPRPVDASPGGVASVFRVTPGTGLAARVQVRMGRASVDTIEIASGLEAGDEVILSDTSRWAKEDSLIIE